MLPSCIFAIALLQEPAIDIPAGYYTVNELAQHLTRQHVQVKVVNSGNDVYAIRFEKRPWKDVRAALVADERLVIGQKEGVWQIERSILNKNGEALALKRYLEYARAKIHAVFGMADRTIREVEALGKENRDEAYDAYPPKLFKDDPVRTAAHHLIYLVGASQDQPFLTVSGPAALSDPRNPAPFGQFRSWTLGDGAHMIIPTGVIDDLPLPFINWKTATDAQKEQVAREFQIGAKLVIDPLTLTIGARSSVFIPPGQGGVMVTIGPPMRLNPRFVSFEPRLEDVWDKSQVVGQRERLLHTSRQLAVTAALKEAEVPERPLRVSETLLRVAEKTANNLVCYVGAFSDTPLAARSRTSLVHILQDAGDGRCDLPSIRLGVQERVDSNAELDMKLPLRSLTPPFSATSVNGTWVVRDEMRFLDGMCVSPTVPATSLENLRLADQKVTLDQLANHVATLTVAAWPTSVFSSNYLHYCNPVSFYPFAVAISRSAVLRKAAAANAKTEVLLKDLEPVAKTALFVALRDARLHNDTLHGIPDPIASPALVNAETRIVITPTKDGYGFRLVRGGNNLDLWTSWVKLH